jgi:hypothetical protein
MLTAASVPVQSSLVVRMLFPRACTHESIATSPAAVRPARSRDPIDTRPGFAAMIEAIAGNGCRTIIVETANRFARHLIVQTMPPGIALHVHDRSPSSEGAGSDSSRLNHFGLSFHT